MPEFPQPATVIGLDVGGTKIAGGVVSLPEGVVLVQHTIPTLASRGGEVVLEDVERLAERLAAEAVAMRRTVHAVGVGLCELISPRGDILSANCVDWMKLPVRARLATIAPTTLEADVRAAARAEAIFGAGRPFRQFLYITVGTGIASCLVLDGNPFTGARGATGTMASSPVSFPCERCGQTNRRTLEQLAAGPALVSHYNESLPGAAQSGHDVLAAATAGDNAAIFVTRSAGDALASTVGLLVNVLDPEAVIVGGGLGLSEGPFWDEFMAATQRYIWSEVHRGLPILRAGTGTNAGVIGAAAAAWDFKAC